MRVCWVEKWFSFKKSVLFISLFCVCFFFFYFYLILFSWFDFKNGFLKIYNVLGMHFLNFALFSFLFALSRLCVWLLFRITEFYSHLGTIMITRLRPQGMYRQCSSWKAISVQVSWIEKKLFWYYRIASPKIKEAFCHRLFGF